MRLIKISDAQELGGALLDAEARIGILLKENPPTSLRDEFGRLSRKATLPEGISWNLSSQCQQLNKSYTGYGRREPVLPNGRHSSSGWRFIGCRGKNRRFAEGLTFPRRKQSR